jgi:phage head maturation protease
MGSIEVRAQPGGLSVRQGESGPPTLTGSLPVDQWTRIDSAWDGPFLERIAPGTFGAAYAAAGNRLRILLSHGQDTTVGDKPIAVPTGLREDGGQAIYTGTLLEGVPELVVSGIRAGQYGSSFRFEVTGETWEQRPARSDHNPDGLPERTISGMKLWEVGPTLWPAYAGATAGLRSLTHLYGSPEPARWSVSDVAAIVAAVDALLET